MKINKTRFGRVSINVTERELHLLYEAIWSMLEDKRGMGWDEQTDGILTKNMEAALDKARTWH